MFIVIKKFRLALIGAAFVLAVSGIVFLCSAAPDEKSYKIIIDAGHGEPDGGAVGADGTKEANLNLSVSKKLETNLKTNGFNTIMTRTDENGIQNPNLKTMKEKKRSDMRKRAEKKVSSGADIFVSIHMNKFEQSKYCGAQVLYDATNERAKILAAEIQNKLLSLDPQNTRVPMASNGNVFLLKSSSVPSVIVECGFLSNPGELEKLKTDEYQNELSKAIAAGIENYFKLIEKNS